MEEKEFSQKLKASEFFAKAKINSMQLQNGGQHLQKFHRELKQEIFQNYINFYTVQGMEDKSSSKKFLNKRLGFAGMGMLTILLVIAVTLFIVREPAQKDEKNSMLGAEIAYIDGDFEYQNSEGGWTDATMDMVLKEGVTLRMADKGKAIVNLDDGSAIRLDSKSQITLESLDPDNIIISNDAGQIYTRVVKANREFAVKVGEVEYRSLGTAYKTINTEDVNGVIVYQSKVEVNEEEKKIEVQEGKKYYVKAKDQKVTKQVLDVKIEELKSDEFAKWNKDRDSESEEFKDYLGILSQIDVKEEPKPTEKPAEEKAPQAPNPEPVIQPDPVPVQVGSISASGSADGGGILISWNPANLDVSQGFKVAFSKSNANPSYGVDNAKYVDANARSLYFPFTDGKTYYFRVCRYTGGGCDTYSNAVSVVAPYVNPVSVSSISLVNNGVVGNTVNISWTTDGNAGYGFKVVWGPNANPTYPNGAGEQYHYYSNSNANSDSITGVAGQTIHIRVCAYNQGTCSAYSNDIEVAFP